MRNCRMNIEASNTVFDLIKCRGIINTTCVGVAAMQEEDGYKMACCARFPALQCVKSEVKTEKIGQNWEK